MKSYKQQPGYNKDRARRLASSSGRSPLKRYYPPKWKPKHRYAVLDAGTDRARVAMMPPGWLNRHDRREQAREHHLAKLKRQRAFVRKWFKDSPLRARPRRRTKPYRRDHHQVIY